MALVEARLMVRPRFRRVAIAACIVLAPIATWTVWDYVEARRLAQVVAAVQAIGAPITPPQGRAEGVSSPDNAARFYDAAAALFDASGLYAPGGVGVRLDGGAIPPRSLLGEVEAFLGHNAEAEQFLSRATALEFRGYSPVNAYDRFSGLMALSALADLRTFERTMYQDGDGAVAGVTAQLRLARAFRAGSSTRANEVNDFVGSNVVARAASEVSQVLPLAPAAAALTQLQSTLTALDDDGMIERQVTAQRARLLGVFWNASRSWYASPPRAFDLPGPPFVVARPWLAHRAVGQAALLDDLLRTARRPWPARLRIEAPRDTSTPFSSILFAWGVPGRDATLAMHHQRSHLVASTLSILRAAMVATAVARYRAANAGALPATLDQLTPTLLPSVPIDPYSGKSLRYAKRDSGFIVYSIGRNEQDDGGKDLNQQLSKRWGPYTRARETADIGLSVDLRASPAKR